MIFKKVVKGRKEGRKGIFEKKKSSDVLKKGKEDILRKRRKKNKIKRRRKRIMY